MDRRAAGLARPGPCRARGHHLGRRPTSLHLLIDGVRIKTLPSRLAIAELARLADGGARPAGPSPLTGPGPGTLVEVERTVNAAGLVGLAGAQFNWSATSWPGSGSRCGWTAPR